MTDHALGATFRLGVAVVCVAAGCLAGCAGKAPHDITRVAPMTGRGTLALDADDVVSTMRRAGFSDEQILEFGPAVRNNIAAHGGARIFDDKLTRAMFMVYGEEIYAVALNRGTFRYEPASNELGDLQPDEVMEGLELSQ